MKTIQTASEKKEALIKARDEWDTRNAEQRARHERQYTEFRNKQNEIFGNIEKQVRAALNAITLNLEVTVDTGFRMRGGVQVHVKSNDDRVHAEDKALSWSWDVSRDEDASISKSSSSWSGLQATNLEQVESLRQTVNALEILNTLDWSAILNVQLPEYSEYVTEKSSIGERPNFEVDIRAAEITELIGRNTLIKGNSSNGKGYYKAWYLIIDETPKQFKVAELTEYSIQESYLTARGQTLTQIVEIAKMYAGNISKVKFTNDIIDRKMETISF